MHAWLWHDRPHVRRHLWRRGAETTTRRIQWGQIKERHALVYLKLLLDRGRRFWRREHAPFGICSPPAGSICTCIVCVCGAVRYDQILHLSFSSLHMQVDDDTSVRRCPAQHVRASMKSMQQRKKKVMLC